MVLVLMEQVDPHPGRAAAGAMRQRRVLSRRTFGLSVVFLALAAGLGIRPASLRAQSGSGAESTSSTRSASMEEGARQAIEALRDRYRDLRSLDITWTVHAPPGARVPKDPVRRTVISRDGRFVVSSTPRVIGTPPPEAEGWPLKKRVSQFTAFDGSRVVVSAKYGTLYSEHEPPMDFMEVGEPVQHLRAPWPMLDRWITLLLARPGVVSSPDVNGWRLSGLATRSGSFEMLVSSAGDLLEIRHQAKDYVVTRRFVEYADREGVRLPNEIVVESGPTTSPVPTVERFTLVSFEANPPDIESRLAFDPFEAGALRLDPVSRRIYDRDGVLVVDEKEREDAIKRARMASDGARPWFFGVIAAIAVVSALLIRRHARAH